MSEQAAASKDRLSKWRKPMYLPQSFLGSPEDSFKENLKTPHPWGPWSVSDTNMSMDTFYASARELIFDVTDGKDVIHFICHLIDPSTTQIAVVRLLETVDATEEEIVSTLAYAHLYEIPIYPNTPELCDRLLHYYKRLFASGFKVNNKGKKATMRLIDAPHGSFESLDILKHLRSDRLYPSAFLTHIESLYSNERIELERARNLVQSLERGISSLTTVLSSEDAAERRLQECLEAHPILFGVEYKAVRKQFRLGSEYQMDFALERWDGAYDALEIERAKVNLYTKADDPSALLVHAEQQVLDWLRWISTYPNYAGRDSLGLRDAFGLIVIGRRDSLTEAQRERLTQRNRLWRSRLAILTYDDLLDKARTMLARISV